MNRLTPTHLGLAACLCCLSAAQAQSLPGFQFSTYRTTLEANASTCKGVANTTARIASVQIGQTHLLAPEHPFFHLSAERAGLIRVVVTGTGGAPAVWLQGAANGSYLGRICLSGPGTLPGTAPGTPSKTTSFVGTVPASWMKPGLQLTVQAGAASRSIAASALKIGPAPVLTFVTMDWLLFGDTAPTPIPAGFAAEFAAKLPLSAVAHSVFPVKPSIDQLPIAPRSDWRSANGVEASGPAVVATSRSHCSSSDKTAGTCTAWAGFGVLSAVRSLTGRIQKANGVDGLAHWYGATSLNRHEGGGLGGGTVSSGDDYDTIFNHELGHAFDMPHWGDAFYGRIASTETRRHPYSGQRTRADGQPLGGGYGDSWSLDPVGGSTAFINPICASTGLERQEPMQRFGSACQASGRLFDHFGDYSALWIHRYFVGVTSTYSGTVTSPRDQLGNTAAAPFAYPTRSGRPNLDLSGSTPVIKRWNPASASYQAITSASYSEPRDFGEIYPLQWNVPVYTLWGSFSNATPAATTILPPLKYIGHLKRVWDPTQTSDFNNLKTFISGDGFWWGADLVAKATFSDGTVRHALVKETARSTDALSSDSFTFWGVNIPVVSGATLTSVDLYHRPMEVRYSDGGNTSSSYYTATNLNSTLNAGLTATTYLNTATLVATRTFGAGL